MQCMWGAEGRPVVSLHALAAMGGHCCEPDAPVLRVTMMVPSRRDKGVYYRRQIDAGLWRRLFAATADARCLGPDVRPEGETPRPFAPGDNAAPDRARPSGVIVSERPPRITQLPTNCHTCVRNTLPNDQVYEKSALAHCLSCGPPPSLWGHDG